MASLHSLFVDEAAAAAAASISSSSSAELNFSRLLQDVESSVSDIDDIDIDIDGDQYTESQKMALSFTQRIAGLISLASGLYIFWKAWKRRDHVFHRLMLGTFSKTNTNTNTNRNTNTNTKIIDRRYMSKNDELAAVHLPFYFMNFQNL